MMPATTSAVTGNRHAEMQKIRDDLARDIAWHVVHGRTVPDTLLRQYRQAKVLLRAEEEGR